MRALFVLLLAQTISGIGSRIASFALGIWLYQRTGSTTVYGLVAFATVAPMIFCSPFAGVVVDRWDWRRALIIAQAGGAVCSLVLVLLYYIDAIDLSTVVGPLAISSCLGALRFPAMSTAVTTLVPPKQLGRANGLVQLGFAIGNLVAPLPATALLPRTGLGPILLADVISFFAALAILAVMRIPRHGEASNVRRDKPGVWREMAEGWTFLRNRPGLVALLMFVAAVHFHVGIVEVVFAPLVLGFADGEALGAILTFGGVGMLLGSVVMAIWGGPRRRMYGVLGCALVQGVLFLLGAARPSVILAGIGAFGVLFAMPLIGSCSQTIWQQKVPRSLQGRVFALRATLVSSALPLAYVLAGPLTDRVFEPLMTESGLLAPTVGLLLGTGRGRGAALLFVVLGGMTFLLVAAGFLYRRLRLVEVDLPDQNIPSENTSKIEGTSKDAA